MSTAPKPAQTPVEAYLAQEAHSLEKHEFYAGAITAMTGGSPRHAFILMNVGATLYTQLLPRGCFVASSDLRVHVFTRQFYTYPDVSVVCDEPRYDDNQSLLNPTLLIEVVSPSTEAYDRGEKFQRYRAIPSLRAYLVVSQDRPHIDAYLREGESWHLIDADGLEAILRLDALNMTLALVDVYRNIAFEV